MARQSEDGNAEAEVLRTLVDQAIYGRARLIAGSLVIWAEGEPHDGRGVEPILLEAVSCSASGRGFESVVRYIAKPTISEALFSYRRAA